jgi:hypothetical protein
VFISTAGGRKGEPATLRLLDQLLPLFPARADTHAVLLLAPRRTKCFIEIPMTASMAMPQTLFGTKQDNWWEKPD